MGSRINARGVHQIGHNLKYFLLMLRRHPHPRVITAVSVLLYHVSPVLHSNQPTFCLFFYPNCDILSGFLSLLLQSLTPSVSFLCLHYYYHHHRGRSLHPCLHCFRRCIVMCIIVTMMPSCCHCPCHALLRFHQYFHSNQLTFTYLFLLYVVTCRQYVASTRHMLSLLYVVTFHCCFCQTIYLTHLAFHIT